MSEEYDGGSAYPRTGESGEYPPQDGMTLRDYFAAAALTGMMAYHNDVVGDCHTNAKPLDVAAYTYLLADAMLTARRK